VDKMFPTVNFLSQIKRRCPFKWTPPWIIRHYHRTNAQIVIGILRLQIPVEVTVTIRIEVGIHNPTVSTGARLICLMPSVITVIWKTSHHCILSGSTHLKRDLRQHKARSVFFSSAHSLHPWTQRLRHFFEK